MSQGVINKTALVTGSTSGIGLTCARALAKRGVNIIVTGFGDESLISSIVAEIKGYGVEVNYVAADLSKVADIDALWSEITLLYPDGIDILVNNAGFATRNAVEDIPDSEWDLHIAVMLSAPFHLTKRCLPGMKHKGWGRIVNISSAAGLISVPGCASYTTSKHGLIGLTKAVALETATNGITCNAVCPSYVLTPLTKVSAVGLSAEETEEHIRKKGQANPTGTFIQPEQVAELVEFLCLSNASSQMTGASYLIDAGYTAQ